MRKLFRQISASLSIKLLLIGELVLLVAVLTLLLPLRREMREQGIRDLQNEVRSIAVTAALQLDGDALKSIRTPADARTPEFVRLRRVLSRVQSVNSLDPEQIYTFYRDGENTVRFGVMTHPKPFVGDAYEMRDEMRVTFDRGLPNVTDLYTDKNGEYISAYAPVRTANGDVVGILEVDQPAARYFEAYRYVTRMTLVTALTVLAISSMLGWLVVNRVVIQPMRKVREGMVALSRQDFRHRVDVHTRDEFQ